MPDECYVYTLAYPDGTVFYIGKGQGNRIHAHEIEARKGKLSRKCDVIREIWLNGGEVVKEVVKDHMTDNEAALLESKTLQEYERENLTNERFNYHVVEQIPLLDRKPTGKATSLYLAPNVLPDIKKLREKRGEEDTSETACVGEAREYALDGIEKRIGPAPELDQLRFMVSNWQALSNHAEIFAPELLNNPHWIALKVSLEQRTDEIGVTAFIRQVGERRRERIENEEDEQ